MFYVPTAGPDSWAALLADPTTQFAPGHSARTLARCWESAQGFPPEVREALDTCDELRGAEMLLGIPEHKVDLDNAKRPSQNDLFVLARARDRTLAAMTVEGKVAEPFDKVVSDWLADGSEGKRTRLDYLSDWLGLGAAALAPARYQLLHRTVSALKEAERFGAAHAVMLVHSFHPDGLWHDDYARFAQLMGAASADKGKVVSVGERRGVRLYLGWVSGDVAFLEA